MSNVTVKYQFTGRVGTTIQYTPTTGKNAGNQQEATFYDCQILDGNGKDLWVDGKRVVLGMLLTDSQLAYTNVEDLTEVHEGELGSYQGRATINFVMPPFANVTQEAILAKLFGTEVGVSAEVVVNAGGDDLPF